MNKLSMLLDFLSLDPVMAMNGLQDAGLVSNNCVGPETVTESDIDNACDWLKGYERAKENL